MKNKKSLKLIVALLSVALIFSSVGLPVFATDTGMTRPEDATVEDSVEENLELGEEQVEEIPLTQVMSQKETQLPEAEAESIVGQKDWKAYDPLSASIDTLQIQESESNKSEVTIGLAGDVEFNLPTVLDGSAQTLWIGYKFTLPQRSPSGGAYSFKVGSYSWLRPLDDKGQITVKGENGNWILEGKVLAQSNDTPIAPGVFKPSLKVNYSGLVNNETAELKGECWIIESDAPQVVHANATMTSKGDSEYYADNWIGGTPAISGYFNNSTGDFSLRKPKNPDGYVYGRVYTGRQLIWNTTGTERLDPTQPLEFDFEYKLYKTENNVKSEVTDPNKMPILMAMKRADGSLKENQLEGSKVNDFTLGNLIADTSGHNGQFNEGFYRGGDYTFKQTTSNVHVSAVLSKDNKNSGYKQVVTYCLIFVPVTEDASKEDMKNPPYSLTTEVKNVKGKSYSDQDIIVDHNPNKTKKTFSIYNRATEEKLPLGGKMSRTTFIANDVRTGKKGARQETRVNIKVDEVTKGYIRDYDIHSINMLIKFEDGLTLDTRDSILNKSGKNYIGDVNFLYAIKEDGTPWASEVEMNHTQDYELRYYDDLKVAEQNGTVVAVLAEFRNGLWVTESSLSVYPYFILTGESGSSQAFVQDVKVWRGEDFDVESWRGTNGNPVEQKVKPTDFMVPYDNPANTGVDEKEKVYRKNIWPDGKDAPETIDGSMYGWTIFIVGGSVTSPPYKDAYNPSVNLNGTNIGSSHGPASQYWSSSTFDTSLGYRVVDRVYSFEVKDIGEKELSFSVTLDEPYTFGAKSYMSRIGKVYLSTEDNPVTYIPNKDVSKQGSFKGGIEIDPENFTVPGDGIYRIYYSSYLGSETELSNDIPQGQQWSYAGLKAKGNTLRHVKMADTKKYYSTMIAKTASTSISKASISKGTKTKAEYNLMIQEHKDTANNTFIMDILPYDGDDAGSSFHGSYKIDQDKIDVNYQSANGEAKSKMKLFYTTNKNIRNRKDGKRVEADIFSNLTVSELQSEFEAGGVIWQEANADSTSFAIPNGDTPTAIVLAGTVEKDERVTAKISLVLEDQKVGDKYNNISSTKLELVTKAIPSEIASVTVIGRNVAGTAWQDKNKNGIFEEGDVTLEGVKVRLYNADHTEITQDANNISYGEVITGVDGSYKFENVPENQDGYYVEFEGTDKVSINDYQTVEQYKSGAKSPFGKNDDSDVIFQDGFAAKVNTGIFKLKLDKDLLTNGEVQNANGINAGFEKALAMKAEKIWNGRAGSENSVKIQLQRRANADVPWEEVANDILSESGSWKTTFDKQPVLYNNNGVARYEYRVVELDGENKPVENGAIITLNRNDYQVKADKLSDDSWKITNNRIVDLTIENKVLGEFGDRTKKFLIVINARDSEGHPISGTFDCEGLDGVNTIEFQNGVANVQLAHDEQIVIKNVAHSTSFDISVDAESGKGYTVKYTRDDGAESDNASFSIKDNSVVKVLNTKTDIPETGISNDSNDKGIFIVLGVLGIAMLGLSVLRKRKGLR